MTDMARSRRPWEGKIGYINKQMLAESISDLTAPIYYIAGPPGMVTAMRKMLADAGIPDDGIRTEEFDGY
jgi:ferredoxin-NADP reductase